MKLELCLNTLIFRLNRHDIVVFCRILMVVLLFHGIPEALNLNVKVNAQRVNNGSIVVDGRPDLVWKAIGARLSGMDTISFRDYKKIVLLQNEVIRNADPSLYYSAPSKGSVVMMAAYDNTALYFFFLVKENTLYNPNSSCTGLNLWKANAPEVYIDPSPWDPDNYNAYFSVDGSGLWNGTSPKTVQLSKPIFPGDSRIFFRNRTTPPDRFQIPVPVPKGVMAVSAPHSLKGDSLFGVEMKIPFWTGNANDFAPGKAMFISWGYNHYPDADTTHCEASPIAYRMVKHYKSYKSTDANKPFGWKAGDSTHFDPTRSWDGWGALNLNTDLTLGSSCNIPTQDTGSWDLAVWQKRCSTNPTKVQNRLRSESKGDALSGRVFSWNVAPRDARGRVLPSESLTDRPDLSHRYFKPK